MNFSEKSVLRSARVLAGFMSLAEAQGFAGVFTVQPQDFQPKWLGCSAARQALGAAVYEEPRILDWPAEYAQHVAAVRSHPAFGLFYQGVDFKMVELRKLLAFQHWVDADVSLGMHGEGSSDVPTDEKLLACCLPINFMPEVKMFWQQVGPGSVTISTFNNTVGVGLQLDPANGAVHVNVGSGANLMLVREHGGRYVLANGYHRAWWLLQHGVEMVPVAMAVNVPREQFGLQGGIGPDVLLGDRPPTVGDFLDDKLSTNFEVRSMTRVVKITSEVLTVPRLL